MIAARRNRTLVSGSVLGTVLLLCATEARASCAPFPVLDSAASSTNIASVMDEHGNCVILVKTVEGKEFMAPVFQDNKRLERMERQLYEIQDQLDRQERASKWWWQR